MSETMSNLRRLGEIKKAVADYYGLRVLDLDRPDRHTSIVRARHAAMWLGRELGRASYPELGRAFGGRDHTTVLTAVRKIEDLRQHDRRLADDLEALLVLCQDEPAPTSRTLCRIEVV